MFLMFLYWCASPLCSLLGRCIFLFFLYPIIVHPSSMHYNMSVIISISLQERSLYITTQKMNGSELLFVYGNVEMVAAFVVYLYTTVNVHMYFYMTSGEAHNYYG